MKGRRLLRCLCLGFCLLLPAACVTTKPRYSAPADYVSAMEKLPRAVDAELHNPFLTNRLGSAELLAAAMNEKPELLQAFGNVALLITNQDDYAIIVLVSPKQKGVAWLEDATWTPRVDRFHFLSNPPSPARFTLEFPKVLKIPKMGVLDIFGRTNRPAPDH